MAPPKTINVLIVDDDRATQRMLADALTKQGFTVTVERDGEWAIKTFEKKGFDAVLLDLLLPALNGYEVARQMRALPKGKRCPIIMISGVYKNALHQREAVQKHGAFAFLEKPMRLQALYDTLKQALGEKYPKPREPEPPPPPVEDDEVTGEHFADLSAKEEQTQVEAQAKKVEASTGNYQVIRGDFAQRPFAEVLAEIYRWRGSGALLLRREKVKKIVFFREGTPVSIKSNLLSECLGRVMIGQKMISEAECEESLTRMKSSKRQQGTVLIEMGCISPHNLQHALVLQLQTKLFDVFTWDQGDYQFNPKADLPSEPIDLGMTCAQVIHEGVKRYFDEARVKRWLGDVDGKYVHPSTQPLYALQDAHLGEEEQQLLGAAEGHKTVSTLRAIGLLSPLDTDRLIFAMKCAQMIELKDKPSEGKAHPSIAELARAMAATAPKPPPLPPHAQPPPLPPKSAHTKEGSGAKLPLPWDDAKPAASLDPAGPPPPPPDASPPVSRGGKKKERQGPVLARSGAGSLLPELSAVHPVSRLSGEESMLRERLAAKVAAMRKLDYFEILGLPTTANREDVKRSYFALAKEYHPDKHFGSASAEVRQLAQQIYDLISSAHDTLADPIERERYVKEIAQGVKRDIGDEVGKILAAEGKFQRGEELMRQREYEAAWRHFQDAIGLYGDEGEFHAWLGWARFQANPKDQATVDEAIKNIEKAITLNPRLDKAYLFLGYIHKAEGRPDKAEKQFEKAIQSNPDCTEALRELRLLGKSEALMRLKERFDLIRPLEEMEISLVRAAIKNPALVDAHEEAILRTALSLARLYKVRQDGHDLGVGAFLSPFREEIERRFKPVLLGKEKIHRTELLPHLKELKDRTLKTRDDLVARFEGRLTVDTIDAELRHKALVLVAGGGGGAGYVYIGVMSLLDEYGLKPKLLVGTSVGAVLALFRSRLPRFDQDEIVNIVRTLSWRKLFRVISTENRYGLPAALRLFLRAGIGRWFGSDRDGAPGIKLNELPIKTIITVSGIRRGKLPHPLEFYEGLFNLPRRALRDPIGLARSIQGTFGALAELFTRPEIMVKLHLGADETSSQWDALDAAGFSCALPGVIHYDVLREDPRMKGLIEGMMETHRVSRLVDGGMVDNLPCKAAWRAVHKGQIGTRNAFILGLNGFATKLSQPLWMPLSRLAEANVSRNRPFAHLVHDFKRSLSPLALVPSLQDLSVALDLGRKQLTPEVPFLTRMLAPLPRLG